MSDGPWIERSFSQPNLRLHCSCGWTGIDADVREWDIQTDRDRVLRRCPDCGEPRPEWGALGPIDGAARIARGPLRASLIDEGVLDEAE